MLWFWHRVLICLSVYNKFNTIVLLFLIPPLRNEDLFFSLWSDDNVTFNALQPWVGRYLPGKWSLDCPLVSLTGWASADDLGWDVFIEIVRLNETQVNSDSVCRGFFFFFWCVRLSFTSWLMQERCVLKRGGPAQGRELSALTLLIPVLNGKQNKIVPLHPFFSLITPFFLKVLTCAWREISFIPGCDGLSWGKHLPVRKEGRTAVFPPHPVWSSLKSLDFELWG